MSGSHGQLYWFRRKCAAFLVRDMMFETTYKLQSVFRLLTVVFSLLSFRFLSRLVGGEATARHLDPYGGDYFTFVVVGIAFNGFFNAGIVSYTRDIRQQLTVGVLEAMAAAPIRSVSLLLYSLLWPMGWELVKALASVLLAGVFFGAQVGLARIPLLLATLALCLLVFGSLGIVAASLIVYFKRGDPIAWMLSSASSLVGGVLFPISILPGWLQLVARLTPVTYALDALRASLTPAADLASLGHNLLALGVFAVLLVPAAWLSSDVVFERARVHGNLGQY
jgi:ABC-2 type transport system permease protein